MNEVEPFLRGLLRRLPKGHRDRQIVESQCGDDLVHVLRDRFPVKAREILTKSGATFYTLTGETIEGQKATREEAGLPAFWHIIDVEDRAGLLALPSRRIEVAIFAAPQEFCSR